MASCRLRLCTGKLYVLYITTTIYYHIYSKATRKSMNFLETRHVMKAKKNTGVRLITRWAHWSSWTSWTLPVALTCSDFFRRSPVGDMLLLGCPEVLWHFGPRRKQCAERDHGENTAKHHDLEAVRLKIIRWGWHLWHLLDLLGDFGLRKNVPSWKVIISWPWWMTNKFSLPRSNLFSWAARGRWGSLNSVKSDPLWNPWAANVLLVAPCG